MYFKLAISKRGRKCGQCSEQIEKGKKYFTFFHFERDKMKYPINEATCLECAKSISNNQFLSYLQDLIRAVKFLQVKINQGTRENIF